MMRIFAKAGAIAVGIIAMGCLAAAAFPHISRTTSAAPSQDPCLDSLGAALAVDTSQLRRREASAMLPREASEGERFVEYRDRSGRRVLTATFFGSTGRRLFRYYRAGANSYALRVVDEYYAAPEGAQFGRVAAKFEHLYYVCGGTLVRDDSADALLGSGRHALRLADSILAAR